MNGQSHPSVPKRHAGALSPERPQKALKVGPNQGVSSEKDNHYHERLARLVAARVALDHAEEEYKVEEKNLKHVKEHYKRYSALIETQTNKLDHARKVLSECRTVYQHIAEEGLAMPFSGADHSEDCRARHAAILEDNDKLRTLVVGLKERLVSQENTQRRMADDQRKMMAEYKAMADHQQRMAEDYKHVIEEQQKQQATLLKFARQTDDVLKDEKTIRETQLDELRRCANDVKALSTKSEQSNIDVKAAITACERRVSEVGARPTSTEPRLAKLEELVNALQKDGPNKSDVSPGNGHESAIKYVDEVISDFELEISSSIDDLRGQLQQLRDDLRKPQHKNDGQTSNGAGTNKVQLTDQTWFDRITDGKRLAVTPHGPKREQAHADNLDRAIQDLLDRYDVHVRLLQDLEERMPKFSNSGLASPNQTVSPVGPVAPPLPTFVNAHGNPPNLQAYLQNISDQIKHMHTSWRSSIKTVLPPPSGPDSFHGVRDRLKLVEGKIQSFYTGLAEVEKKISDTLANMQTQFADRVRSEAAFISKVTAEVNDLRGAGHATELALASNLETTLSDKVGTADFVKTMEAKQLEWGAEIRLLQDVVSEIRESASLEAVDWEDAATKIKAGMTDDQNEA